MDDATRLHEQSGTIPGSTGIDILVAFIVMQLASYARNAPMAAIFATRVRCTGASLCYQLGTILGGAFTPLGQRAR